MSVTVWLSRCRPCASIAEIGARKSRRHRRRSRQDRDPVRGPRTVLRAGIEELLARTTRRRGGCPYSTDMAAATGSRCISSAWGLRQKRGEYAATSVTFHAATESYAGRDPAGEVVVRKSTVPVRNGRRCWPIWSRGRSPARRWCVEPGVPAEGFAVQDNPCSPTVWVYGLARRADGDRARHCWTRCMLDHRRPARRRCSPTYANCGDGEVAANPSSPQDLVHQRDGRALRGPPGPRRQAAEPTPSGRTRRIGTRVLNAGLGVGGGWPAQGHPGVSCAGPGRAGADQALTFSARSTTSTCASDPDVWSWPGQVCDGMLMGQAGGVLVCVQSR